MKPTLLIFLFSLALNFGFGQCPLTALTQNSNNNNSTCITLTWPAGSSSYPSAISIGGTSYALQTGIDVNPSVYKIGIPNCTNGTSNPYTGFITIGTQTCFYNVNGILPIEILSLKANLSGQNLKVDLILENDEPDVVISLSASIDGEKWSALPWSKSINTEDYKFIYSLEKELSILENYEYIKVEGIKLGGRVSFSKVISILKSNSKSFDIYPNPSQSGIFNVKLNCTKCDESQSVVEIYSPDGKKVDLLKINNATNTIDLSHLTGGIYCFKAYQGVKVENGRLVLMK